MDSWPAPSAETRAWPGMGRKTRRTMARDRRHDRRTHAKARKEERRLEHEALLLEFDNIVRKRMQTPKRKRKSRYERVISKYQTKDDIM